MPPFPFPFSSPFGSGFSFVPSPGGTPLSELHLNTPTPVSDGIDRLLDPVTLDYVRTPNGEWAETADNRTTVLIALSVRLGTSPYFPDQGTSISERLSSGQVITPEFIQAETLRVGEQLARAGVLSDLRVTVRDFQNTPLRDQAGRLAVHTEWRDLSSGSPVPLTFSPR